MSWTPGSPAVRVPIASNAGERTVKDTPTRRAAPPPTIPGFDVLEELGRGGMGVVYKARQVKLNRLVALKMILSGVHAAEGDRARFRREAEAAARLQHHNIVQIFEVGEVEGRPFLALEFVGGGSLAQKIKGSPQPRARPPSSSAPWRGRSTPPTSRASSTATSSRPTSCSPRTARPRSATSGWPSESTSSTATRTPASSSARPVTWPPNRPSAITAASARRPTCTPWVSSSTSA